MTEKLILFEHAVETLSYFSRQMAAAFEKMNYHLFFVDFKNTDNSVKHVRKFIKPGSTALLTFNFIGLSGEKEFTETDGNSIWENYQIPQFCIMVDHPMYYYDQLQQGTKGLVTFCVDRGHVQYMHRFYPEVPCYFLPLAGNLPSGEEQSPDERILPGEKRSPGGSLSVFDWIPWEQRAYEVSFIANYVALPKLEEHFAERTQEYIDFYHEILEELRKKPADPIDDVMERMILREIPEASQGEICSAQHGLEFLDLYNRSFYRQKVIRTLVDAGVRVHVFGKDWDKITCSHPENLIQNGKMITSAECVEVIRNSKIALNVMPWFKEGAHDRIFTAMLNGALSVTDDSRYLTEVLTDRSNVSFYQLTELDKLPKQIEALQEHPAAALAMRDKAYQYAKENHTWEKRARELNEFIRNYCNLKNVMLKCK